MDVKSLREIQRREKMSPYLQELGKDFYKELRAYVSEVHSKYLEESRRGDISKLSMALGELENIKAMVSDIYETREKKIVNNALYYIKSEEEMGIENLTLEEENMLRKIIDIVREQRSSVLEKIIGEASYSSPTEVSKSKAKEDNGKENHKISEQQQAATVKVEERTTHKKTTIRLLKDLPSIIGIDGEIYGSFKREDVVTLPEPNARVLINQGAAEYVNVPEEK
jgi:DNA replication initiation complex subunit (GINS family)